MMSTSKKAPRTDREPKESERAAKHQAEPKGGTEFKPTRCVCARARACVFVFASRSLHSLSSHRPLFCVRNKRPTQPRAGASHPLLIVLIMLYGCSQCRATIMPAVVLLMLWIARHDDVMIGPIRLATPSVWLTRIIAVNTRGIGCVKINSAA